MTGDIQQRTLWTLMSLGLTILLTGCLQVGTAMNNKQFPADQYFDEPMVAFLNAVKRNDRQQAQSVRDQGLDLNINGREGITPLMWIIMQWDLQATELMLQLGADPNFPVKYSNRLVGVTYSQPLAIIAGGNNTALLKLLLQYGADPNSTNATNQRPLFKAISQDNWEHFEILLAAGADMDAVDNSGANAALHAVYVSRYAFALELIQRGSAPNLISSTGGSIATNLYKVESDSRMQFGPLLEQIKALLIEKGIPYPPPTPAEQREIRARLQTQ
ncbi:ankyrin repeat domain-containing protein [Nitrincola iocasae]|uniref:Ankyrin repeat domain-containing protein n=1 Tax=Nitrincola iocasae TaxID=2614693 RepID=A0A5J6LBR7_9GAMM|nr:ankyrin repeat domain-containing protein [Nitrincola iocasae]